MREKYGRDYEQGLLLRIEEYGYSDKMLIEHFLVWLSSDQTCEILEDFCRDYGIQYQDVEG